LAAEEEARESTMAGDVVEPLVSDAPSFEK